MYFTPKEIYENFKCNGTDRKGAIEKLISLIDNIDDDEVRNDCIEILNRLDFKNENVFKTLENILISDENENLRYMAAKIIRSKFLKKALSPFLWALKHESSYNCLIIIIKTLKEFNDEQVTPILMDEIKKVGSQVYPKDFALPLEERNYGESQHHKLVDILINYTTFKFLKRKFHNLEVKIENGYVTELDFSKVDNQTIYWRDKCALQDHTDILGILNLNHLKSIKFFSLEWIFHNELTFMSSLALIQGIEGLRNDNAKDIILTQLNNVDDENFNSLCKTPLNNKEILKSLSLSKLSDILRNFLSISYIKLKYPSVEYEIKNQEIFKLKMEDVSLITIPEHFKNFKSLQTLVLKRCKIYSIPKFLASLTKLEFLDLEGNNLKIIPNSISQLQSLKLLNLSTNQLEKLPSMIGNLNSLQHLDLSSNKLRILPRSIGYLHSLKILNIEENFLNKIPSSIGSLKSLKMLNLNSNKLDLLPHAIGLLDSLEVLKISRNNLNELPNTINSLSTLKILEIEENNLFHLPKSMSLLKSLEVLKLGWNELEKLPTSIGSLISLKYLRVANNQLKKIPESICSLSFLEFLEFSQNKIRCLPKTIGNLKSIKVLKISDNQLNEIPDSLCALISLQILNLSGNMIRNLPGSIGMLDSLKELWLNSNHLYYLPNSIGKLLSLEKLNLNNNHIFSLPRSLRKIQNLKDLSLNLNNIDNIFDFPFLSNKYISREDTNYSKDSIDSLDDEMELSLDIDVVNIAFDYPIINRNLTFER